MHPTVVRPSPWIALVGIGLVLMALLIVAPWSWEVKGLVWLLCLPLGLFLGLPAWYTFAKKNLPDWELALDWDVERVIIVWVIIGLTVSLLLTPEPPDYSLPPYRIEDDPRF